MKITIIKPGALTSIQDQGRSMGRKEGVPTSGTMDQLSAALANSAVGNDRDSAVIEFTYAHASFRAETDILIAHAGYGAVLEVNGKDIPPRRPVFILAGTVVSLKASEVGVRSYLAIAGGWQVPAILGSKSTYLPGGFGGYQGRLLKKGDMLAHCPKLSAPSKTILEKLSGDQLNFPSWGIVFPKFALSKHIRVVPAHEFTWFDSTSILYFLSLPFALSNQSDRMGLRFDGPIMNRLQQKEMLSTAVTMGTIQVTGSGELIILMADGQTTGGYPRIAQVAAIDLPQCAQLRPNQQVFFKEISQEVAEKLYLEQENYLRQLQATIVHQLYKQ
ncbi:biotin-dependent carboxyltransferase family protein [Pedobacter sp. UC225_65]|uniref:5-oxoprolinase subunit C family protein n=1 Tax=Pedobacter sp. UC225_65 TaxID=3350173 RepID=UPI00366DBDF1